jgi:ribosomal protein S14
MTAADVQMLVDAAVTRERERCARIADKHARGGEYGEAACAIGDEIRGVVTCEACGRPRPLEQPACAKCAADQEEG